MLEIWPFRRGCDFHSIDKNMYIYIIINFFLLIWNIWNYWFSTVQQFQIKIHKAIIWPFYVTSRSCVDLPRFIWSPLTLLPVCWLLPFIQICCHINMFTCSLHFYCYPFVFFQSLVLFFLSWCLLCMYLSSFLWAPCV